MAGVQRGLREEGSGRYGGRGLQRSGLEGPPSHALLRAVGHVEGLEKDLIYAGEKALQSF